MINYEQFVFFCNCGEELRANPNREATCEKCKRSYKIEFLPQKYLTPKVKEKNVSINKR